MDMIRRMRAALAAALRADMEPPNINTTRLQAVPTTASIRVGVNASNALSNDLLGLRRFLFRLSLQLSYPRPQPRNLVQVFLLLARCQVAHAGELRFERIAVERSSTDSSDELGYPT